MFNLGKETEVKALGKTWTVGRFRVSVLEAYIDWIKTQVGDPFARLEKIIDKLPPDEAKRLVKEAGDKAEAMECMDITDPLVQKFIATARGGTRLMHLMLQEHHPDIDLDTAFEIVQAMGADMPKILATSQGHLPNAEAPALPGASDPTGTKSSAG